MEREKELRTEFNRPSFKEALRRYHGMNCVNCGGDIGIQFHHIVPLADGGTNCITNIVPLCEKCHNIAHGSKNIRERHRALVTGRPKKELNNLEENIEKYINCEVGTKELKRLLGLGQGSHITDNAKIKEYLHSIGIKSVCNNVDIINKKVENGFNNKKRYKAKIVYL